MNNSQRIALVTGSNRGIGQAIVDGLRAKGCFVIGTVRADKECPSASFTLSGFDLDEPESLQKAARAVAQNFGHIDILINNAAILLDWNSDVERLDESILLKTFQTNVLGTMRVTNQFLPLLRKGRDPRIIHISSRAGQLKSMGHWAPAYSISKTALNALTCQQAAAFKADGIAVNCMSPGWVKTDMGGNDAERTPEEGADTAVWLALEAKQDLTGLFFADRSVIPW